MKHVLVWVKRSPYRTYVEERHDPLVERLLEVDDPSVRWMRRSHEDHEGTVDEVRQALGELGAHFEVLFGPNAKFSGPFDLVVTVGGDGTLLGASHQVGPDTPLLGVNSAPDYSVGFFCAAKKRAVKPVLARALDGTLRNVSLSRMQIELNGHVIHRRVLNEALFCHPCPAATSHYILRVAQGDGKLEEEEQRSSGLWVGPAAGSTAAQRSAGGHVLPLESTRIQYVVREPYHPVGGALSLVVGSIDATGSYVLRSKMHEAKLFIDGHHIVFDLTIGDAITLRRSSEPLTVLGLTRDGGADEAQGERCRRSSWSPDDVAPGRR